LLRWTVFCIVTGRKPQLDMNSADYFAIADDPDRSYAEKLTGYRKLADDYFDTQRYHEFCDRHLGHVDEMVHEWVGSPEFRTLLDDTVRSTFPEHEHERFLGHYRGLMDAWVRDHD